MLTYDNNNALLDSKVFYDALFTGNLLSLFIVDDNNVKALVNELSSFTTNIATIDMSLSTISY